MRRDHRPSLALFCLFLFLLIVPLAVSVTANAVFENAYVVSLSDSGELRSYLTDPFDDFSGHWDFSGDVSSHPNKGEATGLGMLIVREKEHRQGYMAFSLAEPVSLTDSASLAYGIYITPSEGNGLYTLTTTMLCGSYTQTCVVQVEGSGWYVVYNALPTVAKRRDIDSITIRIDYANDIVPTQVRLTSPCVSDVDCSLVTHFSADAIQSALGTVQVGQNRLFLQPDNGGAVSFSAHVRLPQYVHVASAWTMAVTVQGTTAGGSLSMGATYQTSADAESWYASPSLSVQEGTHTYYFPVPVPDTEDESATANGSTTRGFYRSLPALPNRYTLHFQGVKGRNSAGFSVTEVAFYPLETTKLQWVDSTLGSMTEATVRDGVVTWSGKLTRQAMIDHSEADVALLAVPLWDRYNLDAAVELARMRVSKNFTFTLDAADFRTYAAAYLFYTAIRVESTPVEGTDATVLVPVDSDDASTTILDPPSTTVQVLYLPITEPQMLSGNDPNPCSVSLFGLHGADTVGVFESNVSHVTVDVYLDRLLLTKGTGVVCSFGGKSWHLSQSYLEQLDSDVLFYIDAGLEVSLRILSEEPFTYSTSLAESYLPLVETEEAASRYGAVLSYLCSRYTGVASITLGKGIHRTMYTGLALDASAATYLCKIASLAAMTYETARLTIPDIYIVIPFSDDYIYQQNRSLPPGTTLAPELSLVLFSDALHSLGSIPWVASWRFESDTAPGGMTTTETAALPGHWHNLLQQLGISVFGDFLYRWEPESCLTGETYPYSFATRYETLCQALASASPRAVVLSIGRVASLVSPTMYTDMTALQDPSGKQIHSRQVMSMEGILSVGLPTVTEDTVVTLWDFADSYSAEGFIGSGGIDVITTTYSAEMRSLTGKHTRVLRTTAGADGILLRNFAGNVDLSGVDSLTFTFRLTGNESSVSPTAVFFLGAEDWRMEYHVTGIVQGEILTVTCPTDTLETAVRCGYIGVMLSGNNEITLDLASVAVHSTELTEDALSARFDPTTTATSGNRYDNEIWYILLLVGVATVCIFVLLMRRDREEEEHDHA